MDHTPPFPPHNISLEDLPEENRAYGQESMRRGEAFQQAGLRELVAVELLLEARGRLRAINRGRTRHRSLAQAITKAEEAIMWVMSIQRNTAPHDGEHAKLHEELVDFHIDDLPEELRLPQDAAWELPEHLSKPAN